MPKRKVLRVNGQSLNRSTASHHHSKRCIMSEKISIVILGVVSLIAVLGLVLMFNGDPTGAVGGRCATGEHIRNGVLTCRNAVPVSSGLPCSRNPNGQCSQGDDCMVGIQTGKCDTTCNCQLTQPAPTGKTGKKYVSPAERQGFNPQPEPPGKQAQYVPQATH